MTWKSPDQPNPQRLDELASRFCTEDDFLNRNEMHEMACLALADIERLHLLLVQHWHHSRKCNSLRPADIYGDPRDMSCNCGLLEALAGAEKGDG
jgi:hypothetical protein